MGDKNIKRRPEGIIFDIGGVLLDFDHMKICRGLSRRCVHSPEEVYEAIFSSGLEALYDSGRLSSGEFYTEVLRRLGIKADGVTFEEFSAIWCEIFMEKKDVTSLAKGLLGSTRLMILSNTNELHFEFARRKFPFLDDFFQWSFLSYKIGSSKPDPVVFKTVIDTTGIGASRLFFIDDRQEYVDAGIKAGIESRQYVSPEGLKNALKSMGF